MATTMQVEIVSAEQEIFSGTVAMLFATAEFGEVGIAPRHAQMICRLKPGQIRLELEDGTNQVIYVSGGMLEVQPHIVTVLSDTAIRADDLDSAAAEQAKQRAEDALANQHADFDYAKARVELAEAIAQLQAIRQLQRQLKK